MKFFLPSLALTSFLISKDLESSGAISISDALLEDMIPREFESGEQSQCSDPGTTNIRFKNEIDFSETIDRWDTINADYESQTFLAEMSYTAASTNTSWTVRFGQGGNIYSIYGAYGEAIPPQGLEYGPFVDEVLQTVTVDTAKFALNNDYYIHQAGVYNYRTSKLPERPEGILPPFYSPSLGMKCFANTCRFMSWGQQAHLPTRFRSDVLYFHEYRNCGDGIIEYTQVMQYSGDPSESSGSARQIYMNTPWTGIRTSKLPDLMFSGSDGTLKGKVYPMPQFGTGQIIDSSTTGGFTTFSKRGKDPEPPLTTLAIPCVETSGSQDSLCTSATSLPLEFHATNNCLKLVRSDGRLYVRCRWPKNPHTGFDALASPMRGCQTCGKRMQIKNPDTNAIVQVDYILDWHRNGDITFQASECTSDDCSITHDGIVQKINQLFFGHQVLFSYAEDTSYDIPWDQAHSLTLVHGQGWSRPQKQNLQYGKGGGSARRDMTVFTMDSVANLYHGETFVSRQYLLSDTAGNAETRAQTLKGATYSTVVSNSMRKATATSFYGGRKVSVFASGKIFGVVAASTVSGQSTSCGRASATVQCEGVTVPKDQSQTVNQLRPFFYITCGVETYFGPDQYHFSPPVNVNNTYFMANICENSNDPTSRPVWKLLGYFSPSDPGCISLSDSQYDSTFCDQSEISEVPSEMPTISTLVPSISRSNIPSVLLSNVPSSLPSDKPSNVPSIEPSFLPTLTPSEIPSNVPSVDPSLSPTLAPSRVPTNIPSVEPSLSPTLAPSGIPSNVPSIEPSLSPTLAPSGIPSNVPSIEPSLSPTLAPSGIPSNVPSIEPSLSPTLAPSENPSGVPTRLLSLVPSKKVTLKVSSVPSLSPNMSYKPSKEPTSIPTELNEMPSTSPTKLQSCGSENDPCVKDSDCCSGSCSKGPRWQRKCIVNSCSIDGDKCRRNRDCCSHSCSKGRQQDRICVPSNCLDNGESCRRKQDCCSRSCHARNKVCCVQRRKGCEKDSDCCSGNCTLFKRCGRRNKL